MTADDNSRQAKPSDLTQQQQQDADYNPEAEAPDFAPAEPTDGRGVGDWQSRYTDKAARIRIRLEASYVICIFLLVFGCILSVALDYPKDLLDLADDDWTALSPFMLAFLGGAAGGTLFSIKWLYHSVARGIWNCDRWLWRVCTPMLAAGAALTLVVLSASRIIPIFGPDLARADAGALGIGLLVGYFSDRTFSRLERLAEQHLGPSSRQARQ